MTAAETKVNPVGEQFENAPRFQEEILKEPRSPIFIHPGSGMVFHGDRGEQFPIGARRKILAAFAQSPEVPTSQIKQFLLDDNSPRSAGTIMREMNIFFREKEDTGEEEPNLFVIDNKKIGRRDVSYRRTRDIHILEDHELAWAAVAFPTIDTKTQRGGLVGEKAQEAIAPTETGKAPTIKAICESLGIYTYNGTYIKIGAGEQHAIWMVLADKSNTLIPNNELANLINDPDEPRRKTKLNHRLSDLSGVIEMLEGKHKGRTILERSYISSAQGFGTRLLATVEREIPQNPSAISSEQAAIIGNIFALRGSIDEETGKNGESAGLPLKIGQERDIFVLDKNIRPVIERLVSGCMQQSVTPRTREAMLRSRAVGLEIVRQFFNFSPAIQEIFIRSHGNEDIRTLLRWMRDENERGILQGIVHPFLATDTTGKITTELYDDIQKSTLWVAPPEAIAARYIKKAQRETNETKGQQLLVAFD